jgi:hypothetical protein
MPEPEILSEQEIAKIEHFQPTGWYPVIVDRLVATIRSLQAETYRLEDERLKGISALQQRDAQQKWCWRAMTGKSPCVAPSVAQRPQK